MPQNDEEANEMKGVPYREAMESLLYVESQKIRHSVRSKLSEPLHAKSRQKPLNNSNTPISERNVEL